MYAIASSVSVGMKEFSSDQTEESSKISLKLNFTCPPPFGVIRKPSRSATRLRGNGLAGHEEKQNNFGFVMKDDMHIYTCIFMYMYIYIYVSFQMFLTYEERGLARVWRAV